LQKGCNFWEWELEYVRYLIDHDVIQGDAAVHALGWADEREDTVHVSCDRENRKIPLIH
jgi:hypothetical protein